jgi:hypothetical protein
MSEIEFNSAGPGEFHIGDKVRVVLEGTLTGYSHDDGHYYLKGASWDKDGLPHIPWLYPLHWSTEFHVIEPGPRNLGNGATNPTDAFAATEENA